MTATVNDIIKLMEEIAPVQLAEPWDNPGLQVGDRNWTVRTIMIALDPTLAVLKDAEKSSVDMLVTHHPLIFRPLKSVDVSTPIGGVINIAIRNSIAVYAAHTNLDSATEGLNDMLVQRLGLKNVAMLAPNVDQESGLGRVGDLPGTTDLLSLCKTLKAVLGIENVRIAGCRERQVRRVAVCTGSGGSLLDRFFLSDADVFITGDVRYHDARDVEERGSTLVDIGHFGSEHIMVEKIGERLGTMLEKRYPALEVITCKVETDPFVTV